MLRLVRLARAYSMEHGKKFGMWIAQLPDMVALTNFTKRMYHSSTTAGTWRPRQLGGLLGKGNFIPKAGKVEKAVGGFVDIYAEEFHSPNADWSSDYFSGGYITKLSI